jgi:hypothetical protein
MKNQHRKFALRGETVRALTNGQLTMAHGGRMKEPSENPGATIEGCEISNGPCQSGGPSCGSLACPGG